VAIYENFQHMSTMYLSLRKWVSWV